ncbi:Arm DNA-binding domain-containing protein [Tamlana crocina]|uniref:Arm DNA-binding domain-containing protein n=1 Tax=Tamlana crocina TaxID=393006 RepID=A0ABX1DI52_9FLAO|nr:Arm DNA-binding domain-containing protein [Tamlana crocina]NJX16348.1 hypothetical protein [Tamlana crocina]
MGTSRTFSIHFWLNVAKKKGDLAPIYARVTVDGKRAEISLQRQTSVTYWDTKSKKTTSRTPMLALVCNECVFIFVRLHSSLISTSREGSTRYKSLLGISPKSWGVK